MTWFTFIPKYSCLTSQPCCKLYNTNDRANVRRSVNLLQRLWNAMESFSLSIELKRKLSVGLQSHDIKEPSWVTCCLFSRWEEDKTWNHIIRLRILSKFQKSPWLYHRSVCPVCISGYICDVLSQPSGCKYRISLIGSFNGSISSDDMCDDLEGGDVPTINYFLQ